MSIPTPTIAHKTSELNEIEKDQLVVGLGGAKDDEVVHLNGTETIPGVKTFTQSPIIPVATESTHAVQKSQLDDLAFETDAWLTSVENSLSYLGQNKMNKADYTVILDDQTGSITANFLSATEIVINAIGNVIITPTNVPDFPVKLIVNKSAAQTIAFAGVSGTLDSKRIGATTVTFFVYKMNDIISVSQLGTQFGGSLVEADLTPATVSITGFDYFGWQINNNICTLEAKFTVSTGTTEINSFTITLGENFNVTPYFSDVPLNVYNVSFNHVIVGNLSGNVMTFKVYPLDNVLTQTLRISANFRISLTS